MLTAKQEAFARAIVMGIDGEPCSQVDAYRHAYDVASTRADTHYVEASQLVRDPKVSQRIEELKREIAADMRAQAADDRTAVLARLREWMHGGDAPTPQQVRAAELLGKTVGMFRDVVEDGSAQRSPDEIANQIEAKLAKLFGAAAEKH